MHCSRGKKKILSIKTARYSQSYKCFIIIVKTQKWINYIFKISWENDFLLIELSWQHYHLLSSLEGEEKSILLALILWKAKQSAVFLRMLLLPFKINDDLKDCSFLCTYSGYSSFVDTILYRQLKELWLLSRVENYRKWIHNDWISVTSYFYCEDFYSQPDLKLGTISGLT